jgi:chromosomal replication initiator protein
MRPKDGAVRRDHPSRIARRSIEPMRRLWMRSVGASPVEMGIKSAVVEAVGGQVRSDSYKTQSVDSVLRRLTEDLGEDKIHHYFKGQTRLALNGNRLEVTVPSGLLARMLEGQFGANLRHAASCGGEEAEVVFRVDRAAFDSATTKAPEAKPQHAATAQAPRPAPAPKPAAKLQARFTFESFIVGNSNKLAYAAAKAVAEGDGPATSLFLHGSCGLGKTHLLHAVAAAFLDRRPTATVKYTTAEAFTNEFVTALRLNKVDAFRRAYRRVDLLCLDDAHFFSNKEATQNELLHTFDAIGMDGARVVIASDEHPREAKKFSDKLVSRFMAGAVVRIDTPDDALRTLLVRSLAERRGLRLDEAAIKLLCDRSARSVGSLGGFGGSVREIEGLLIQIEAIHRLLPEIGSGDGSIGAGLVRRALGLTAEDGQQTGPAPALRPRRPIAAQTIVSEVCRGLNVELTDFMGKGRHPRVVLARSLCSFICRKLTTLSFPEIARAMGRSNHSTVITAHRRVERDLLKNTPLSAELAPHHAGCTLAELSEALSKQVVRGAAGL